MLIECIDKLVDLLEVGAIVPAHGIKRADVKGRRLTNNYQQNVLANLHLTDEVLVIHHAHLEVLTVTQLVELSLEVIKKLVHSATETI